MRMNVEYENGKKSIVSESVAKILEARKVLKILGPAKQQDREKAPKAKKVIVK